MLLETESARDKSSTSRNDCQIIPFHFRAATQEAPEPKPLIPCVRFEIEVSRVQINDEIMCRIVYLEDWRVQEIARS